jgi:penicillin-binding protein 2
MLATPLQVVDFIAAVGNGGTLYRPQMIEKIVDVDGQSTFTFSPVVKGKLPISQTTLTILQDSLRGVVADKHGTANSVLASLTVPVAGKTGTAQNPNGAAHAWFAGYSMENDPKKPDIAVVVLLENGGEGSQVAAPIFRRAISLYFSDNTNAGGAMPWESSPFIVRSPTPVPSDTPVPTDTVVPTTAP